MTRSLQVAAMVVIMAGPATAQDTSPVVVEGVMSASVDTVWEAWTTNEGLGSWLAPHAEVDLRIGGLMRANYNAGGALGDPQTVEREILSFEPKRMISFRVVVLPEGFPFTRTIRRMWTVIYFEPLAPERTRLRAVSLGFDTSEESQSARAYFEQGNARVLQQLENQLSAGNGR